MKGDSMKETNQTVWVNGVEYEVVVTCGVPELRRVKSAQEQRQDMVKLSLKTLNDYLAGRITEKDVARIERNMLEQAIDNRLIG